jgi:NAD+ synthase (glutamine-hydrolysing)
VRLALCQINATVGDIDANAARIRSGIEASRVAGAELVLVPELAITGYPPEDLLLRAHFLEDAWRALTQIAKDADGAVVIVGFPELAEHVYNAAAVLAGGVVQAIYRKLHLPNYGVFDERRYFVAGEDAAVLDIGAHRIGLSICEDIWEPGRPVSAQARAGASLIVNISASPYHAGKGAERERMLAARAREELACVAFCALVGGQDELVFDGCSLVLDHNGRTLARGAQFTEDLVICDLDLEATEAQRPPRPAELPAGVTALESLRVPAREGAGGIESAAQRRSPVPAPGRLAEPLAPLEAEIYAALELGLRDYVEKNGFGRVVLGLSGGIDSALVATLAVDALGPERVSVAVMPSPYSSTETQADARSLAGALAAEVHELPIEEVMDCYGRILGPSFEGHQPDITEENLQARIRGNLLMALSNKFGWLVLTTGNKSEMSVGYTTLYGDLAGGFAVIKDVPKTLVYRLARWRNSTAGVRAGAVDAPIPAAVISRAPSAELRVSQLDADSLPPYELLDRILEGYIELDQGREQLVAQGLPSEQVDATIALVDRAEYKRRQAPPGIKVTVRAFGRDRRMPITNRYRDGPR